MFTSKPSAPAYEIAITEEKYRILKQPQASNLSNIDVFVIEGADYSGAKDNSSHVRVRAYYQEMSVKDTVSVFTYTLRSILSSGNRGSILNENLQMINVAIYLKVLNTLNDANLTSIGYMNSRKKLLSVFGSDFYAKQATIIENALTYFIETTEGRSFSSQFPINNLFDLDAALALAAAFEVYARISFTRTPVPASLNAQVQLIQLNEAITSYCTKNHIDLNEHKAKLKNYITTKKLGFYRSPPAEQNYHDSENFAVERKMSFNAV